MSEKIYHERQRLAYCAVHTLNNILQKRAYTKEQLDEISKVLSPQSWINPHRSVLGIGNYDVNCIEKALFNEGLKSQWFDNRLSLNCIDLEKVHSFIINDTVPENAFKRTFRFIWESNHWFGCKKFGNVFYNLDSKIEAPVIIGEDEEFLHFLQNHVDKENHIFIVLSANEENWKKSDKLTQNS